MGGAIPANLLELANTDSNSSYQKMCRTKGFKVHPARFPPAFAEYFIKFLTDEDDIVFDLFSGSNTTGYMAELMGRRWLACELSEEYLEGSAFRFDPLFLERFESIHKQQGRGKDGKAFKEATAWPVIASD
jgi:site-specific DNA-methyltransferase (cytosine-N4-specific)